MDWLEKLSVKMSWTLCTSEAAVYKAGAGANSAVTASHLILAEWSDEVEASINMRTRKDWVAGYAGVGANFKAILADVSSDMIGMKIITYDMSGYTSRLEAQTMLDVARDNINTNIKFLDKDEYKEKM